MSNYAPASTTAKVAKLFNQDIVARRDGKAPTGIVMRCWHDAEDTVPPPQMQLDPLMRNLSPGEVGVSFYRDYNATLSSNREFDRQILFESELQLLDRLLHPGDLVKRALEDTQSGVVLETRVQGRCEHVISGQPLDGWVSLDQLADRDYNVGDIVAYDGWIGQVIELYDEVLVETSTGEVVRLPEIGSRLAVGERGADILPAPPAVHSLFGFILGNTRPSPSDTCVEVTHTVYAITWLAISQELDPDEAAKRQRPPKFFQGADTGKLILLRSVADSEMRVGDRVTFKDESKLPSTVHGLDGTMKVLVKTFTVTETRTVVDVLWQDGTRESSIRSTELIPYLNPDEYDCWPGDWVLWNTEDERRPVIVQSVDAPQRTASVRVAETGKIELVSVLELDTHGASDALMLDADLGVRRGDWVFIHPEGRTNGSPLGRVPRIGEVEPWVREPPFIDNQLAGFRKDMSEIGADIARQRGLESAVQNRMLRLSPDDQSLLWFGEVADVCLDGTVEVTHPNGTRRHYPLQRLTKLYDGIDQLEDGMWDEMSEGHHQHEEDGQWDWETDDGASAEDWGGNSYEGQIDVFDADQPPVPVPIAQEEEMDFSPAWPDTIDRSESDVETPPAIEHREPLAIDERPLAPIPLPADESGDSADEDESLLERFRILPSAPIDHAYYATPPAQPTKLFMSRLSKEYRALSSSLPDSILVRAFEDRVDLLRCMILGPTNTPYTDAPFVIDWMLDSNFPHSPPMAHFLSWTNGNGRVNPNLYEEGKVCLSILGTWAGDKNEIWSAARSSLLQAFVSIQGLVLVKEPWFCEPAYEKLRGTEEGIVNSRLYSEKAYVLSRGFVRRALELPPGGLETEIEWLFYRTGRLDKVIEDAQALIQKSRSDVPESEEDRELAVPRLSVGGIISLERTLVKLVGLRRS
ncbi:Isocitrate lyase [Mycena chlorophos]|uniref:Isocitrate lyase n=1 Tax=Mycena chlorophos TaxID=658473 RepID=A0A8H6T5J2_MYCCL|nr:Isocitrate lyase [Mycena chlorophos]